MNIPELLQIVFGILLILLIAPFLGFFISKVYSGEKHFLSRVFSPLEKGVSYLSGTDFKRKMTWKEYALAVFLFNIFGFLVLFLLMVGQGVIPFLNPQKLPGTSAWLAFNTAMSFMTNTNWQAYSGESTMSYATQMLGLGVQNFVSAGTGMAVMAAMIRGLAGKDVTSPGNFWKDLTDSVVYILLPLSILFAVIFMSQGVIMNFASYVNITGLEGGPQVLPMGPGASQIAIKQIGTNGGGFFGINSAHPFENPTPLSNFFEWFAIIIISASLPFAYGKMVGSVKQGTVIFVTMFILFLIGLGIALYAEYQFNPVTGLAGNMEGKETRLGITNSVLWGVTTTVTSNGSVNAMHDSFLPLAGMVALFNMMLGEIVFGGVGCGLYGMLIFVIITVFISGLMVGRTPEYLGKKIEAREVKWSILAILAPGAVILVFSSIAVLFETTLASRNNLGPHGLSEILYAFSSAAGNNGSAFAGLNADTPFYNSMIGLGMFLGRFVVLFPALAIGASMGIKKITPISSGTFRTDGVLFVVLLIAVILVVGGLTFLPALGLGPIVEHLIMMSGKTF